ncbi:calcium-binding protein [Sulfitobacter sp. HNIBRBA2951]|uniref:calcium-binding protein n=1 Tax=Sulfitobacter aquimarinus TaxID=3158557 RepID=UPI0032E04B1B
MITPVTFDFDLSDLDTDDTSLDRTTITALNDGGVMVTSTVFSGSSYAVVAGIMNADGSTRVPFFEVSPDNGGRQIDSDATLLSNGNVVVAWHASYDGRLPNRYDANGAVTAVISPQGDILSETFHGYGREPSVTALANGSYAVAWWASERWAPYGDGDGNGIFGQRINADGTHATARTQINVTTDDQQDFPTLTTLSNGNIVASWFDEDYDDFETMYVRGIILNSNMVALTPERELFTLFPGGSGNIDLEPLPNGRFVAASTEGVRIFNADGTLSSTLDLFPSPPLSDPRIDVFDNGDFVVVWASPLISDPIGDSDAGQILLQRFHADGTPASTILRVDFNPDDAQERPDVAALPDGRIAVTWYDTAADDQTSGTPPSQGRILTGNDQLTGPQDDILFGTNTADYMRGWAGNDILNGNAGNDTIDAGAGADRVVGNLGDDLLILRGFGAFEEDLVAFNVSSATQIGTQAQVSLDPYLRVEDVTLGGGGFDTIRLEDEDGVAFFLHDAFSEFYQGTVLRLDSFGRGSTTRFDGIERIVSASFGDDLIDLTSPDYSLADQQIEIDAGEGFDIIWGSDADETILGGRGNDTLFGGTGTDVLTGGFGADVFEFTRTSTDVTITDFDASLSDSLLFYNAGGATFDASSAVLSGNQLSITYADADTGADNTLSITILGATADVLSAIEVL